MSTSQPKWSRGHTITAGIAGNVLEWYDFAVYGFFAPIIARQFFPSEDPTISLIATFGAFAAGVLAESFEVQVVVAGFAMLLVVLTLLAFAFIPRIRKLD